MDADAWTYRHRADVHVWLKHFDFEPELFTRAIGIEPTRVWRAGAHFGLPSGKELEKIHRRNSWMLDREVPPGNGPREVIEELSPSLERAAELIRRLRDEGGDATLTIHLVGREGTMVAGDTLDPVLLARLGALGVAFSFEAFA